MFSSCGKGIFYYPGKNTNTQTVLLAVCFPQNATLAALRRGRGWGEDQEANVY